MPCDEIKLKDFSGSGACSAESWFQKFELAEQINDWKGADIILQLPYHLTGSALAWFSALDATVKADRAQLIEAFKTFYLKQEPQIVTESKLLSRKMQIGESIEEYTSDLIELGAKIGRSPDSLATTFLNGLPSARKQKQGGTRNSGG